MLRASACSIARSPPSRLVRVSLHRDGKAIELRPGTILSREWNGQMHRVAVRDKGFDWNGKTYRSLSKVALAITGTRWNGPRFFGLRDNPRKGSSAS
jgi:hypothetical protein